MLQLQNANDKGILILISDLISEINKRNQNNAGVKQAIKLLNTSKDRIEKGKETPDESQPENWTLKKRVL